MTPARLLAPLALALTTGALLSILLAADPDESSGDATPTTLADVAQRPREVAGRAVVLAGVVAASRYLSPADATDALVLGDERGHRVLVLPVPEAAVPHRLEDGAVVEVTGRVRVVEARRARRGEPGRLGEGDLLARSRATAVVHAASVRRRDGGAARGDEPAIARTSVAGLRRGNRSRFAGNHVAVSGRAHRLVPTGFVLVGERRSIFVAAPAEALARIGAGERIRVRGTLRRMSRYRADTARAAIAQTPEAGSSAPGGVRIDRTPAEPGGRYVALAELSGADD